MKRFLILLFAVLSLYVVKAQSFTASYGLHSSFCPQTGQYFSGLKNAQWVEFYDTYVIHSVHGTLFRISINPDGSSTYMPSNPSGDPTLGIFQALIVSGDRSMIQENMVYGSFGMSFNTVTVYSFLGKGKAPCENYIRNAIGAGGNIGYPGASGGGLSGGSSGHSSSGSSRVTCSRCGGSGVCKSCGNTGGSWEYVDHYTGDGTKAWINCGECNGRKRCPICYGRGYL